MMEIINLDLFFDKRNKNIMNEVEFNNWIKNRIRPVSQARLNSSNGILQFYRLYDNGLSLFASSKYRSDLDCSLGYGETLDSKLRFIVRELKKLKIEFVFYDKLDKEFLVKIGQKHEEGIKCANGNNLYDVIEWVLRQQSNVEEALRDNGIRFVEEYKKLEI